MAINDGMGSDIEAKADEIERQPDPGKAGPGCALKVDKGVYSRSFRQPGLPQSVLVSREVVGAAEGAQNVPCEEWKHAAQEIAAALESLPSMPPSAAGQCMAGAADAQGRMDIRI